MTGRRKARRGSWRGALRPGALLGLVLIGACTPSPKFRSGPIAGSKRSADAAGRESGAPRERIEAAARSWLGTPYRYGGVDRRGIDCSALAQHLLGGVGAAIPRTVGGQRHVGKVVSRDDVVPGDLIFFRLESGRVDHVGVALDGDRFVHASSSKGVVIERIDDGYFARRIAMVRRVLGSEGGRS